MENVKEESKDVTVAIDDSKIAAGDLNASKEEKDECAEVIEDEADIVATRTSNSYAAKKTVAQGMMDIALITSNANQLRYLMEYASETKTYYLNLVLITISLILQVAVGVSLLFKGKYQLKGDPKHKNVSRVNTFSVIGVFMVTLINVFIASFTMSEKTDTAKVVTNQN